MKFGIQVFKGAVAVVPALFVSGSQAFATGCHGGYCNGNAVPEIDASHGSIAMAVLVCAVLVIFEISRRTLADRRA